MRIPPTLRTIVVLLCLSGSILCFGQKENLSLDFRQQIRSDSLKIYRPKKIAFDFQFDNRNSFIRNKAISIQGINIGLNFASGVRWGIGGYRVIRPFQTYRSIDNQKITTDRELDLYYITPNFQYTFINKKWIDVSVNLEIGFGSVDYIIYSESHTKLREKKGFFVPSGIGTEVLLIPIRWIGLDGMIGYRKSLKSYEINADFDGMYYSYGVKVFLGVIYHDLKYHHRKKQILREAHMG